MATRDRNPWRAGCFHWCLQLLRVSCWALATDLVVGGERDFANVPPSLEIEVLDPRVDANGNPAVVLRDQEDGTLEVDVPPTVLVHRYYYSGDRSFQGPMLRGGPCILVANHPQTGERCYIPATLMPGAPRVRYRSDGIEYDYGEHAVELHFGLLGKPTLRYRRGAPLPEKVANVLHWEQVKGVAGDAARTTKEVTRRAGNSVLGLGVDVSEKAGMVLLPVRNLAGMLPLGQQVLGPDVENYYAEKAAEYRRRREIRPTENEARRDDL